MEDASIVPGIGGGSGAEIVEECPCCNNPWRRVVVAAEQHSAAAPASGGLLFCGSCTTTSDGDEEGMGVCGLNRSNLDWSVSSSDNFYRWSNGGWMKRNPIPPEYPSWNTFVALHVQSQQRCKDLLEELLLQQQSEQQQSLEAVKLALFYQAAMNEDKIEQEGMAVPLTQVMNLIQDIVQAFQKQPDDKSEYAFLLGRLAACYGVYAFLGTGVSPDAKDSNHCICQLYQGGLGLPDRDYYFDDDKQDKRQAYQKHVAHVLSLYLLSSSSSSGEGEEDVEAIATAASQRILDLETKLADSHMTRTENRDPIATYNKQTIASLLQESSNQFDFEAYLCGSIGMNKGDENTVAERLGEINVRNVQAMKGMAQTIANRDFDATTLKDYLQWHVLKSCAPYLTQAAVRANFDFYEKTLSGTQELKPRWKRAMAFTESALGEALGKLYCERYFDESSKERALNIVESVRAALEQRLRTVEWIQQDSTRQEALKKMSKFRVKIGYPNEWIDYSTLELLPEDSFIQMVFKARTFDHAREVKEMNAPTNREKWFLTPQTVNAYYHPNLNEVVFPAAILQHPFFDKDADDAVNYGSMGAVVGHEMTHGFDDKGRKFNSEGELHDWWSEDDTKEYEARVKVMVDQASEFQVHGMHVKGQLTSGENIADLGGLRLALAAMQSLPGYNDDKKTDGFTATQRFFMAWAQCWRQNITKERSLQLLSLDPHGPNELRCNGPLSNMPEFHRAFQVPPGAPMYIPTEKRVDIW